MTESNELRQSLRLELDLDFHPLHIVSKFAPIPYTYLPLHSISCAYLRHIRSRVKKYS